MREESQGRPPIGFCNEFLIGGKYAGSASAVLLETAFYFFALIFTAGIVTAGFTAVF